MLSWVISPKLYPFTFKNTFQFFAVSVNLLKIEFLNTTYFDVRDDEVAVVYCLSKNGFFSNERGLIMVEQGNGYFLKKFGA